MGTTYTIELDTPGAPWADDVIEVELTTVSFLHRLRIMGEMPEDVRSMATQDRVDRIPAGIGQWIETLVTETSDFPPELLGKLEQETMTTLLGACSDVFLGAEPSVDEDDGETDLFGDLDLNDDGSVDPDEWR